MTLPLVVLFVQMAQTPAPVPAVAPPEAKPVRVWLASSSLLLRGDPVQVYVQAAADGYLVVLHRRTDGRIEVLFPGNPGDDPYVRAGTYEIGDAGNRESFVVAEPDGTGLILAALSPASYRFDEFVRTAAWDPDALAPSWSGADAEGALADIVQRMLGDGYFNYDVVTYTVVPRPYAMQDTTSPYQYPGYASCTDCTFIGYQQIIYEAVSVCDAFFSPCLDARPRFRPRPRPAAGICGIESPCIEHTTAMALALPRAAASVRFLPQSGSLANKDRAAPPQRVEPRSRVPGRATPLNPGRRREPGVVRTRAVAARAAPAAFREARLTLSPTAPPAAVREREGEEPPAAGAAQRAVELVPVLAVQRSVPAAPRSRVPAALLAPSPVPAQPRARAVGGAAATARMQGMALPAAGTAWHATGRRR